LLLEFINISERYLVDTLLHYCKTCNRLVFGRGPEIWIDEIYRRLTFFSFISTRILLGLLFPSSAKASGEMGKKLKQ